MNFKIKKINLRKEYGSCIVVGVFENCFNSKIILELDNISNGSIKNILNKNNDFNGKLGETLLLYEIPNINSYKILFVGFGKQNKFNYDNYKIVIHKSINIIKNTKIKKIFCFFTDFKIENRSIYWTIRWAIELISNFLYEFNFFKKNKIIYSINKVVFNLPYNCKLEICELAIKHGIAITEGINLSKNISNMPPNICNSEYLNLKAKEISNLYSDKIKFYCIKEKEMKELGMNAFLAVNNGSNNEAIMSIIEYNGNLNSSEKIVLVGKALTFDSGGISIKTSSKMNEMKFDMCGASTIYGIIKIIAELDLSINIIGVIAIAENMIDSKSYRPGDIITTMSGKTVEILNTDAEGRLVLCDALTYISRYKPEIVIDISTLTQSCVIALGTYYNGLMCNNKFLSKQLIIASKLSKDEAWELPLNKNLKENLKSNCADISNCGNYIASAITAGYFLSCFAKNYKWAHLDIAGTSYEGNKSTGRPIIMLIQFIFNKLNLLLE